MKYQALFYQKNNEKYSRLSSAAVVIGALRVNSDLLCLFQVASLRVFQVLGVLFILFGILGKIGAALITIPYSVVGGMQMINFGILVGLMLSNLQVIDLKSTRNLAIIGMSMLIALMMPEWIRTTKDPINTGNCY